MELIPGFEPGTSSLPRRSGSPPEAVFQHQNNRSNRAEIVIWIYVFPALCLQQCLLLIPRCDVRKCGFHLPFYAFRPGNSHGLPQSKHPSKELLTNSNRNNNSEMVVIHSHRHNIAPKPIHRRAHHSVLEYQFYILNLAAEHRKCVFRVICHIKSIKRFFADALGFQKHTAVVRTDRDNTSQASAAGYRGKHHHRLPERTDRPHERSISPNGWCVFAVGISDDKSAREKRYGECQSKRKARRAAAHHKG